MNPLVAMFLGSLVRYAATSAGGIIVAKGLADADTATAVTGAAVTLGGFVWSLVQKWRSNK